MRVANKLTPETKNKTTKPGHGLEKNQVKTLQLLVPKSKRLEGYTEDTRESAPSCLCGTDRSQASALVVYVAKTKARQALDRSRKVVNTKITCKVVYIAKTKARQSTRQVK